MKPNEKNDNRLSDKAWRVQTLYKIKNKQGKLVVFTPNKMQVHFDEHKHTRNILLKARQLGASTYETIDMLDDMLFTKNYDCLVIAHGLEQAKDIFDNKVDLAWLNFKLKDKYQADMDSARKLKVGFGDGTFSSMTVDTSGRSGTFRRVHVTEFAKLCKMFPDRAREVIEGTIPAVPTDGRFDIESTAEEASGYFYEMFWQAWNRGDPQYPTQFKAHFYNWQWDPEIETIQVIDVPKEFRTYQAAHNLTAAEISYFYLKFISLGEHERNWATMKKEYPTTPEEAFEGAGNKLFSSESLNKQTAKKPKTETNDLRVWKPFILGHRYGIGADVAEGIGRDSSTIVVWDFSTIRPRIVATYANNNVAPDLFAYEIRNLAVSYGSPVVAVERNNHGHTTLSKLREIYQEEMIYKCAPKKWGWETNLVTKPDMLYDLNTAVNEYLIKIPSKHLLSEMRRYDKEELRELKASEDSTSHFDLLMAAAIGFKMRNFQPTRKKDAVSMTPDWVGKRWAKKGK